MKPLFAGILALCLATPALGADLLSDRTADLNGDGKADKVTVSKDGGGIVKIKVGSGSASVPGSWSAVVAKVTDVRVDDGQKEVLLDGIADGVRRVALYRYDGKTVARLFDVTSDGNDGTVTADGDGMVHVRSRTGFFMRHRVWMLGTGAVGKGALVELPQPYHYVGAEVRASEDTNVFIDRAGEETLVIVKAGQILQVMFATTDAPDAYLVVTEDGLVGWLPATRVETLDLPRH